MGAGVAFTVIMMGIVLAYLVWPKLERARIEFIESTACSTERERGEADTVTVALAGATFIAALLVSAIAVAFA